MYIKKERKYVQEKKSLTSYVREKGQVTKYLIEFAVIYFSPFCVFSKKNLAEKKNEVENSIFFC